MMGCLRNQSKKLRLQGLINELVSWYLCKGKSKINTQEVFDWSDKDKYITMIVYNIAGKSLEEWRKYKI